MDSVGFSLWIEGNESLISLAGLENMVYIGDGIDIAGNTALHSLTALSNVTSLGYELQIAGNHSLTSLSGLDNIEGSSIHELYIVDNAALMTCEVQSICDYLADPSGFTSIYNNATGCNSVEEVENACSIGYKDNISQLNQINLYPNPVSDQITIEITGPDHYALTFLNINGQKLEYFQIIEPRSVLDISNFTTGVYFVKLSNSVEVRMFKLVKY